MKHQHIYDFALSFAGEDRTAVEKVATELRQRGKVVFYDRFEQTNLWGKNLYDYLEEVYSENSRYCVIFLSSSYLKKEWTRHERKSAQARQLKEESEYILPVRIDDAEFPATLSTTGAVDLRKVGPSGVAKLLCEKIEEKNKTASPPTQREELVVQLSGGEHTYLDDPQISMLTRTLGRTVDISQIRVVGYERSPARLQLQATSQALCDLRKAFLSGKLQSPSAWEWEDFAVIEGSEFRMPRQTMVYSKAGFWRSLKKAFTRLFRKSAYADNVVCHAPGIVGCSEEAEEAIKYLEGSVTNNPKELLAFVTAGSDYIYIHSNFQKSGVYDTTKIWCQLNFDLFTYFQDLILWKLPTDEELGELLKAHQRHARYIVKRSALGQRGDDFYAGALNVRFV